MQSKKVVTFVLDWTIRQPLEISIPENSIILDVLYINKYDHLFAVIDTSLPKIIRKFICKKTNENIEDIENYSHITSTVDETGEVWHIFEFVKQIESEKKPPIKHIKKLKSSAE